MFRTPYQIFYTYTSKKFSFFFWRENSNLVIDNVRSLPRFLHVANSSVVVIQYKRRHMQYRPAAIQQVFNEMTGTSARTRDDFIEQAGEREACLIGSVDLWPLHIVTCCLLQQIVAPVRQVKNSENGGKSHTTNDINFLSS